MRRAALWIQSDDPTTQKGWEYSNIRNPVPSHPLPCPFPHIPLFLSLHLAQALPLPSFFPPLSSASLPGPLAD